MGLRVNGRLDRTVERGQRREMKIARRVETEAAGFEGRLRVRVERLDRGQLGDIPAILLKVTKITLVAAEADAVRVGGTMSPAAQHSAFDPNRMFRSPPTIRLLSVHTRDLEPETQGTMRPFTYLISVRDTTHARQ